MKSRRSVLLCALAALVLLASPGWAQSLRRQLRGLAAELSRGYLQDSPQVVLRLRIGIPDFSDESPGAKKNSVGRLVSALLTEEFAASTLFTAIERKNLQALLEEAEFSLSDLADPDTAPEVGRLEGLELLVLGTVNELAEDFVISARLVEVQTGRIAAAANVQVPREQIEAGSREFLASSFQSRYGLSIAPVTELLLGFSDGNLLMLSGVELSYRLLKNLGIGLGYAHLNSDELDGIDQRDFTVTATDSSTWDTQRIITFFGDGISVRLTGYLSPSPRISLGLDLSTVVYFHARLRQDMIDFPAWYTDGTGSSYIDRKRIVMDGFTHSPYLSYHARLTGELLVSRRLSLLLKLGGFWLPAFTPVAFEYAGDTQDSYGSDGDYDAEDIDRNGTFDDFPVLGFNFARTTSGDRMKYGSIGGSIEVGAAVHF